MTDSVAIIMATYNGEQFVRTQIQSILKQSYTNFVLFIQDDYSSDQTVRIIEELAKENEQIKIFDSKKRLGSAAANFMNLWQKVTDYDEFDFYMFCDQDDYWLPNKIALEVKTAQETISTIPVLVHTDLEVVDHNLNMIAPSFLKYSKLNGSVNKFNRLLVQNNVTGCTMLWNNALNQVICTTDNRILMHDWWIALIAAAVGEIKYVSSTTIKYRQHSDNVLGAEKVNTPSYILARLSNLDNARAALDNAYLQALSFSESYSDVISDEISATLDSFLSLRDQTKFFKIITIIRRSFWKQTLIQSVGELVII